jgi:hypothetical protein
MIILHYQDGIIPGLQGLFNIYKLNTACKQARTRITISINADKAFDKIQHLFMTKALKELGTEGSDLNIIRATHNRPKANSILNRKKMKAFSLKLRMKQQCTLSSLLFNIEFEFLVKEIR